MKKNNLNKEIIDSDNLNEIQDNLDEIELIHYELDNVHLKSDNYNFQSQTKDKKYLYVYNHITLGQIFYTKPIGLTSEYIGKIKLEVDE